VLEGLLCNDSAGDVKDSSQQNQQLDRNPDFNHPTMLPFSKQARPTCSSNRLVNRLGKPSRGLVWAIPG
jgi:hypothetical protein